jgi:hypothetical protein
VRIAIAGASGTGKTYLAKFISDRYNLPICPVGSRSVAKAMGFESPYDVDKIPGKRLEFQLALFEQKREWEASNPRFVTDRTHFDNLAYCAMHDCADKLPNWAMDAYVDATKSYTRIFYLPVTSYQKLGDDPMRVDNPTYHLMFDMLLHMMLLDYVPQTTTILSDFKGRMSKVGQILGTP